HGFDLAGTDAGTPPFTQLVFARGNGDLETRDWDGITMSAPGALTNDAGDRVSIVADTNGLFMLAWAREEGGIGLYHRTQGNPWVDLGTPFPAARP
ncbi:MAG: hypothetical protein AAF492_09915, partial [Verrucomicrobiota bacterium]